LVFGIPSGNLLVERGLGRRGERAARARKAVLARVQSGYRLPGIGGGAVRKLPVFSTGRLLGRGSWLGWLGRLGHRGTRIMIDLQARDLLAFLSITIEGIGAFVLEK
jgi:hypothetical protein